MCLKGHFFPGRAGLGSAHVKSPKVQDAADGTRACNDFFHSLHDLRTVVIGAMVADIP